MRLTGTSMLLLAAVVVFGVILGSDPSPMGTVKDAKGVAVQGAMIEVGADMAFTADDGSYTLAPLTAGFRASAFAEIFAQLSRNETARLKTGCPGLVSGSTQK